MFIDIMIKRPIPKTLLEIIGYYNGIICGSYAAYCCADDSSNYGSIEKPSDIDVYFPNYSDWENCVKFLSKDFTKENETFTYTSFFSYPIRELEDNKDIPKVIQLIKPKAEFNNSTVSTDVLKFFDFTVSRVAIKNSAIAVADKDFLQDYNDKILRIKHISCPINILLRIEKYLRKGYSIANSEYLKVFESWDTKDNEYKDSLRQFLGKIPKTMTDEELYNRLKFD